MQRRYPIILHSDDGQRYGVTVPDLPGCFTVGEDLDQALQRVQEAVEAWLGDAREAPAPSRPEQVLSLPEAAGGVLAMVQVDLGMLDSTPVRVNISLPRSCLRSIDDAAKRLGMTRSGYLRHAVEQTEAWRAANSKGQG